MLPSSGESLVIVNQIDAAFGELLAAHPSKPQVIDQFDSAHPWRIAQEAQVLVTRALASWRDAPAAVALPRLDWVQTYSSGIEIYPDWLVQGRTVTNGRGLTAPQIAEYVMAAILLGQKDLWHARVISAEGWGARAFGTLEGKTLGLLGFGAIGAEIVRRARGVDLEILVNRRGAWDQVPKGVTPCQTAAEVVSGADHLVLALPHTPQTDRLLNAALLAQAKPGLHVVNVARGGLIDDQALLAALDSGQVGRATLDVTRPEPLPDGHPLYAHPDVLITPHVSYQGGSERLRFERKMLANLTAYLAGAPMTDVVDLARGY